MPGQPLIKAVEYGDAAAVKSPPAAGADANKRADGGVTPLMRAAAEGNLAEVEALLRGGAAADSKRYDGWTALILASFFGHAQVVKALLIHGADVSAEDGMRMTALKWAQAKGRWDVCALLEGAARERLVRQKTSPRSDGCAPGPEDKPRSAELNRGGKGSEIRREVTPGKETTAFSRRPARATVVLPPRREQGVTRPDGLTREAVLFDVRSQSLASRSRYYAGALSAVVILVAGVYLFTDAFKKPSPAQPVQHASPPAARSAPDLGADPRPARPDDARPSVPPAPAHTPELRGSTSKVDTGGEPHLETDAPVRRSSEQDSHLATPAESEAVVRAEAEPTVSPKPEAGSPGGGRQTTEVGDGVRVVLVPTRTPALNEERRGVADRLAAPPVSPAPPPKKKVIPWP